MEIVLGLLYLILGILTGIAVTVIKNRDERLTFQEQFLIYLEVAISNLNPFK